MLYQERDNRFRHTEVYIMQIKGIIASSRKNYSSYEQSAVSDGMPFICVNIEDENGKPLKSITRSPTPFSTEEEINLLMTNKDQQKKVQLRFDSMKNDLLDTYLAFVEDTAGSRIRFKQTEIKKNDPANPAFFSSFTTIEENWGEKGGISAHYWTLKYNETERPNIPNSLSCGYSMPQKYSPDKAYLNTFDDTEQNYCYLDSSETYTFIVDKDTTEMVKFEISLTSGSGKYNVDPALME